MQWLWFCVLMVTVINCAGVNKSVSIGQYMDFLWNPTWRGKNKQEERLKGVKNFIEDKQKVQLFLGTYNMHPLYEIVKAGWSEGLDSLLKSGKYDEIINMKERSGANTMLHMAVSYEWPRDSTKPENAIEINKGRGNCCKVLLRHGADPLIKNNREISPFSRAFVSNKMHVTKMLFGAIGESNKQKKL